jgi:hypothetical protein
MFFLAPPSPGGSRGRVWTAIFPKEILGFIIYIDLLDATALAPLLSQFF